MIVQRHSNGDLSVPMRAEGEDGDLIGDGFVRIGPDNPDYQAWEDALGRGLVDEVAEPEDERALVYNPDWKKQQRVPGGRKGGGQFGSMPGAAVKFGPGDSFANSITIEGADSPYPLQRKDVAPVKEAVDDASRAVATVHRWPGPADGQANSKGELIGDPMLNAQFFRGAAIGGEDTYRVGSEADHPGLAVVHEMAHGLDFGALSRKYGNARDLFTRATTLAFDKASARRRDDPVTPEAPDALENVALAIQESETWKGLRDLGHSDPGWTRLADYMQEPSEALARAYEQYVGQHADDPETNDQFVDEKKLRSTGEGSELGKFWYWPDEDFAPIDKALTDMFKDLEWDKPSQPNP